MKNNKFDISHYFKNIYDDSIAFFKKIFKNIKTDFNKLDKKKKINITIGYSLFVIAVIVVFIILNVLFGYDSDNNYSCEICNNHSYIIDYLNETDFEKELNDEKKVYGKVVKFLVNDYKPNSTLGINIWSGEHLNFISNHELDVKKGDFVIGRVTEEPSKVLGSWKINFYVLRIEKNCINENNTNENDNSKLPVQDLPENVSTMTDDKNNSVNQEENSSDNSNNNTSVGEENNISKEPEKEEIKYNFYTTNSNEDAKLGNKGIFSYVKKGVNYDIYWIVDFDGGYVYNFFEGNGDDYCYKIKIKSGNLNDGVTLSYKNKDNAWVKYIHFKYTNQPHQLVIVDNDYFTFEYETVSLESSLKLKAKKTIYVE